MPLTCGSTPLSDNLRVNAVHHQAHDLGKRYFSWLTPVPLWTVGSRSMRLTSIRGTHNDHDPTPESGEHRPARR